MTKEIKRSGGDYNKVFQDIANRHRPPDHHIDPFPRHGLAAAYVFTRAMDTGQLREALEAEIGVSPKVGIKYAVEGDVVLNPILYVLPAGAPKNVPRRFLEIIQERGLTKTSAALIRGATNVNIIRDAVIEAGQVLHSGFQNLYGKLGDEIGWYFREAGAVNTNPFGSFDKEVLTSYDPDLAGREVGMFSFDYPLMRLDRLVNPRSYAPGIRIEPLDGIIGAKADDARLRLE